jgi:hypothetical protein
MAAQQPTLVELDEQVLALGKHLADAAACEVDGLHCAGQAGDDGASGELGT